MAQQKTKHFTQRELKRLFKAIEAHKSRFKLRNIALFRIAYFCGLRASELGLIRYENYNKATGELYCQRLKGSWNNTIRLNKETKKALDVYIKHNGPFGQTDILFKSQENKPISRKMLDYLMKKYCKIAKVEDKSKCHFHTLKHSCGVHLAESALDLKEVNFWLAHKNIANTMVYFQFTTKQQEQMYRKLEKESQMV